MATRFLARNSKKDDWKSGWPYVFVVVVSLMLVPIVSIFTGMEVASLTRLPKTVFSEVSLNTVFYILQSVAWAIFFGVGAAWVVTFHSFRFRSFFQWALVLPLTIPTYVVAYVYKGMFEPFGTVDAWLGFSWDVANLPFLSLITGAVLFPYVYVAVRGSLLLQSTSLIESALLAGKQSSWSVFKSLIPIHLPAIMGGSVLVGLECLNEYGAVHYFGIKTYTSEILRLWNPTQLHESISLAVAALLLVAVFLFVEYRVRNRRSVNESYVARQAGRDFGLNCSPALSVMLVAFPLLIGLFVPVAQMLAWAAGNFHLLLDPDLLGIIGYTFALAFCASLLVVLCSFFISFFNHVFRNSRLARMSGLANLGYAVPGAVIGIGMLIPAGWLGAQFNMVLTASVATLVVCYVIRFQAVGFNAIDGAMKKLSPNLADAGATMGFSRTAIAGKIIFPQMKMALVGGALLCFVDVCKELPLTMLFQRFNQETLAVRTFVMMDTEGGFYKASVPALLIVSLGIFAVLMMSQLQKRLP